jgi:hypothetical protein
MMREQLIWRPNAVPLEVWEAMTREAQIAWWKSQSNEPPQPKRHMKEAISQYNKGIITLGEFVCVICKLAAQDEIEEVVRECPDDLLSALNDSLASYGEDESTWPRTCYIACDAPWVTPEEIESSRRQEQQQIWDGVRLLKNCHKVLSGRCN